MAVDPGCPSSLSALHLGIDCLHTHDAPLLIVGGVNSVLIPHGALSLTQTGASSPEGKCKTLDSSAERCGVVILNRLSDAIRDGDRIYSVILASMLNQDGQ